MRGLEISRMFFEEWGLPYIRTQFPQIVDRVAAGLFSGSQSIGADDEVLYWFSVNWTIHLIE